MLPTPTKKRGFRVEGDPRPPPKSHPPCLQGLTLRNSLPYCRSDASSCVSGWVVAASYATLCVMGKGTRYLKDTPPPSPQKIGVPQHPTLRSNSRCRRRASCCNPARLRRRPTSVCRASSRRRRASAACRDVVVGVQNSGGGHPQTSPTLPPLIYFFLFFTLFCLFSFCCWTWAAKRPSCGTPGSFLTAAFARFPWGDTRYGGAGTPKPDRCPSPGLWGVGGGSRRCVDPHLDPLLSGSFDLSPCGEGQSEGGVSPQTPPTPPPNPPRTDGSGSWLCRVGSPPPRAKGSRVWRCVLASLPARRGKLPSLISEALPHFPASVLHRHTQDGRRAVVRLLQHPRWLTRRTEGGVLATLDSRPPATLKMAAAPCHSHTQDGGPTPHPTWRRHPATAPPKMAAAITPPPPHPPSSPPKNDRDCPYQECTFFIPFSLNLGVGEGAEPPLIYNLGGGVVHPCAPPTGRGGCV